MNLDWKKILILIGFILAVILIGYILYFLFLKPSVPGEQPTNTNLNTNTTNAGLPTAGTNTNIQTMVNINGRLVPISQVNVNVGPPADLPAGTVTPSNVASGGLTQATALTTNKAYDATLAADGNSAIYYDKSTGLFYKITADGRTTTLSDQVFYNVEKVTWASGKNQAVLEYPDGSNIVYNFDTDEQVTLPKHWEDFSFSPTGGQLVLKSISQNPDNSWIAISNADGTAAKKIEHLGDKDETVKTDWSPNQQIVATWWEGDDLERQTLYFLGQNNENFKATVVEGYGIVSQWSTQGDRLLYSANAESDNYIPNLWVVDAQGNAIGSNRRNLNLQTWADKCSFYDNSTLYCAVPTSLPDNAGLFRDQYDTSPSEIYKIDLTTGFKSKVAVPTGNHNIESLSVTKNGNYLYFVSKTDGKLYKINLK